MIDFAGATEPKWYRTCQECGHKQYCKKLDETKPMTPSYMYSKCRNCKSESLDYGTYESSNNEEDYA